MPPGFPKNGVGARCPEPAGNGPASAGLSQKAHCPGKRAGWPGTDKKNPMNRRLLQFTRVLQEKPAEHPGFIPGFQALLRGRQVLS
jgi:hypothetical protein